jgi:hypothetical protein
VRPRPHSNQRVLPIAGTSAGRGVRWGQLHVWANGFALCHLKTTLVHDTKGRQEDGRKRDKPKTAPGSRRPRPRKAGPAVRRRNLGWLEARALELPYARQHLKMFSASSTPATIARSGNGKATGPLGVSAHRLPKGRLGGPTRSRARLHPQRRSESPKTDRRGPIPNSPRSPQWRVQAPQRC